MWDVMRRDRYYCGWNGWLDCHLIHSRVFLGSVLFWLWVDPGVLLMEGFGDSAG